VGVEVEQEQEQEQDVYEERKRRGGESSHFTQDETKRNETPTVYFVANVYVYRGFTVYSC